MSTENYAANEFSSRNPWFARIGGFGGAYILAMATLFFLMQHFALGPVVTKRPWAMALCRLLLDLLVAATLTLVLGRRTRVLWAIGAGVLGVGVVTYAQTFHQPPSIYPILFNTASLRSTLWAMLPLCMDWRTLVLLGLAGAAVGSGWRRMHVDSGKQVARRRAAVVALATAGYAATLATAWFGFSLDLSRSQSFDWYVSRSVAVAGFAPTWFAQAWRYAGLSGDEPHYEPCDPSRIPGWTVAAHEDPKRHLIFIQVESLDWNAITGKVRERDVMPYLSRMAGAGECRKIEAFTKAGSVGMDFVWATGYAPVGPLRPSDLRSVPITNGVPWRAMRRGYDCIFIHGNTGEFYGRRFLWQRFPGVTILFGEELQDVANRSYWGVRDRDVLERSARLLQAATRPQCHFIITLDTHGPYDIAPPSAEDLFPGGRSLDERYLNSLHVLDRELGTYFESVSAPYTAVIYGDHAARGRFGKFRPAREGATEYVPLIVWRDN